MVIRKTSGAAPAAGALEFPSLPGTAMRAALAAHASRIAGKGRAGGLIAASLTHSALPGTADQPRLIPESAVLEIVDASDGDYFPCACCSTCNWLSTEKTFGTPFAWTPATFLSKVFATTPFSVT